MDVAHRILLLPLRQRIGLTAPPRFMARKTHQFFPGGAVVCHVGSMKMECGNVRSLVAQHLLKKGGELRLLQQQA
jgi:hypothetical protein